MSELNNLNNQNSSTESTNSAIVSSPKKKNTLFKILAIIFTVLVLLIAIVIGGGFFLANSYQNQVKLDQSQTAEKKLPDSFVQNSKLYSNPEKKFEIKFPNKWETKENYFGSIVSSLSAAQSVTDTFRENVNVVNEELPNESLSLAVYTDASLKNIENLVNNFSLISKEETTVGNRKAMVITYTGKQGTYDLKFRQTLIVNKKMAYVISYVGAIKDFDTFLPEAQNIADSFKVMD